MLSGDEITIVEPGIPSDLPGRGAYDATTVHFHRFKRVSNTMASRNYPSNRIYNNHIFPVQIDARISIGATGAPTIVTSSTIPGSSPTATMKQSIGILSFTRLSAGRYEIQLDDNFTSLVACDVRMLAAVTGSDLAVSSGLSTSAVYQLTVIGTTTTAEWHTLGVPAGMTPAAGMVFKAASTGTGSGSGKVKAIGTSGITSVELIGTPNVMLNNQPFVAGNGGGIVHLQCLAPTASGDTALIPADPSDGATMLIKLLLSNSSIQ